MVMTSRASELLTNTTTALFNGQVSFCKIGEKRFAAVGAAAHEESRLRRRRAASPEERKPAANSLANG
jgi:hypothetical protein